MKANPSQMRTFLVLCDAGSIAGAARRLGLSAPAVSKQLAALEGSLEVSLLERSTRRMVLTPAGQLFRRHATETLRLLDERESRCLSLMRGEPSGTLRVVAARWLGETCLVPRLDDFLKACPGVELQLELAERFPDMEREEIDLIFGMSMPGSNGMVRRTLGMTAYWLCAAPDYLARHGVPETPDQLAGHRLIGHSERPMEPVLLRDGRQVEMRPMLRLNDTKAMITAARQGLGIAWLHHYMVCEAVAGGELCRLLSDWERPPLDLSLFYRASGRGLPSLRHFIDFAVAACQLPALEPDR